ncbi:hypothetical protein LTR04_006162, partial [Oleoguttula sp. CCFEE 6159]
KIARQEEDALPDASHPVRMLAGFGKKKSDRRMPMNMPSTEATAQLSEKEKGGGMPRTDSPPDFGVVTDQEWHQAARAARTATWGAIFYLITTDVLGPYSVPTGYQIWQMFLALDSTQYPMKTFGDIAFRIYGTSARHLVNVLQSLQLIFNVGVIIIANGQGLYQVNSNICYIVCCVIWTVLGMFIGQIRTLQKFGWIANLAIWLNVVVMILTMAVVTHSDPNYDAASTAFGIDKGDGTVHTTAGPPATVDFTGQIVGLMQAVYSYGGAMLYCEFMSEMRKPCDFWKALLIADSFIYIVYLFFGLYVYSFQGQYTINPANQGMSPYGPLLAGNIISFVSSLIAAALYGNIGIKVLYQNIFKELFGLPDLTSKAGKLLWVAMVPVYWGAAFVLAAAIPNFSALSGLVAALCILQFTYTFPPVLMLGLSVKRDAMQPGEGFDPATGRTVRHDHGFKRWSRGMKRHWYIKLFNLVFFLGAIVTAVLGCYSSVKSIVATFGAARTTAFGCKGPI